MVTQPVTQGRASRVMRALWSGGGEFGFTMRSLVILGLFIFVFFDLVEGTGPTSRFVYGSAKVEATIAWLAGERLYRQIGETLVLTCTKPGEWERLNAVARQRLELYMSEERQPFEIPGRTCYTRNKNPAAVSN